MANICNESGPKFPERGSFVKKGTAIIRAEPFVFVLNSKLRKERCDNCLKSCKISRCSGCRYVHYCSRNCQRKSWSLHKVECPNMKRIQPLELPDAARLMGRIITKLRNGGAEERGYYYATEYKTFKDLMSHYENIKKDPRRMEHFTSVYAVLKKFFHNSPMPSAKELLEIFGRMSINSFHILDNDWTSVGVGLYLGPSIIDHSCKANASTVFEGTTLIIHAIRDIPSFDWSKVSISYTDVIRSVDERRAELQSAYYFRCNCERCVNPEPAASAAACPNKNCRNPCFPSELKCSKCDEVLPPNYRDDFELMERKSLRCLEKFEKMENIENDARLEMCRMCLTEQDGLFHPMNLLHARVLEEALPAACEMDLWEEAEIYAKKLIQCYEYYYSDFHPLTGNTYFTLAKILSFNGRLEEACSVVRKAWEIVEATFGANHSKMLDVVSTAHSMRMECERTYR